MGDLMAVEAPAVSRSKRGSNQISPAVFIPMLCGGGPEQPHITACDEPEQWPNLTADKWA